MIIIDYFGFSGSGKSFSAKDISKLDLKIDLQFLINKYFIIKRLFLKYILFHLLKSELKKFLISKCFIFEKKLIKFKNLISFLYLIGFIKYKSKSSKI